MERLELGMDEGCPAAHRGIELVGADGHEAGVFDGATTAPDPVGDLAELTWCLVVAAHTREQGGVQVLD
jgi:hypothetical protein